MTTPKFINMLCGAGNKVFPFTVRSKDTGHFIIKPEGFGDIVRSQRGKLFDSYYAYDVTFIRATEVKIVVYDMFDNFRGGIGKEIASFEVEVELVRSKPHVDKRIHEMAKSLREEQLRLEEEAIVKTYEETIKKQLKAAR